jgi:hypothetical protein
LLLVSKRFFSFMPPYETVSRRPVPGKECSSGCARVIMRPPKQKDGEFHMSKILSAAILAGLMFGLAAPAVQAKDAPKTKADCAKMANMKWDDATSKCVKK